MTLITESYRNLQSQLHEGGDYGLAGRGFAPVVSQMVNRLEVTHLLDYGCGSKLSLLEGLKCDHAFKYQAYDPAVAQFADPPFPAEMVACIDVLEHIEPELLDAVLDDLKRVTEVVLFVTVHTGPALRELPDGRNAHLIQQPMEWWLPKLWERFALQTVQVVGDNHFYVVAYAKDIPLIEDVDGNRIAAEGKITLAG